MKKYSSVTKKEIIEQIKAGEKVTAISKKYGISRQTIYRWLAENADSLDPKRRRYGELERYSQKLENIIEILKYGHIAHYRETDYFLQLIHMYCLNKII